MHMSAMLRLFGLNCDILCLYFTKVLFTVVILHNFYDLTRIYFFFGLYLAKSCWFPCAESYL
jgi:hypothetical protein